MKEAIKDLLIQTLSKQAYAALIAIPGFGWVFALPVVRPIVQYVLERVAGWLVQETAVGLSILWIQVDMAYEVKSVEEATARLRDMLDNPTKYTEKEQAEIETHFDAAAVELINLSIRRLA